MTKKLKDLSELANCMKIALIDYPENTDVKWEPVPNYGDLMLIDDFKEACDTGSFIDSDGMGYYAIETAKSAVRAKPSDFRRGIIDRDYTHIIWFNK